VKFLLGGFGRIVIEHDPLIRRITETRERPQEGDEIILAVRGRVARLLGDDEVEVENLQPVKIIEITRGDR
jgi:hypothetical protein